jgi:Amt family ammonium transporter
MMMMMMSCSGIAGLVSSIILGHRKNYGREAFQPHNILLTAVGAFLLWVGWFGFNGGSAVGASTRAGMAMLCTHISAGDKTVWTYIMYYFGD